MSSFKKLTLYWNPLCPFVHRVLITLEEKGAAKVPERVFIPLGEPAPEWYRKINPKETVPTLTIEGEPTVFESLFVAEYIDRTFGAPNQLLPNVASVRADIREFQSLSGDMIGSLYGVIFTDEEGRADAIKSAKAAVAKVEAALVDQQKVYGGPFFLGTQFTLADINVVPFLQRMAVILPAYADFDPLAEAPALRRLHHAASIRPSVFSTSQPASAYVSGYAGYAKRPARATPRVVRGNFTSPFAQRILIAAALANVEVTVESVGDAGDERLPRVTINEKSVHDSQNGLLYLLESQKAKDQASAPLVPANDNAFARAQFITGEADSLGTALINSLKKDAAPEASKELHESIEQLESIVAGPFAVGTEASFADAVLVPHLARLVAAEPDALSAAPKLSKLFEEVRKLGNVSAVLAENTNDNAAFERFVQSA
jgi:glutathione S-transferase